MIPDPWVLPHRAHGCLSVYEDPERSAVGLPGYGFGVKAGLVAS
jgi:hypothetical protein